MKQIFKIDENDNVRVWSMEIDGANFRTHSGVLNGKIVISGWKTAKAKNVGKVNATTPEEQAQLEVERKYADQIETGGYYETIEEARTKIQVYFDCMLAHKWKDHKDKVKFPLWSQPKLDGIRCIATKDGLKSRNGKPLVATPHIMESLAPIFAEHPNFIFDGELYNHELKSDFEKIVSLTRKTKPTQEDFDESREMVQFHIYDMFNPDYPKANFEDRIGFIKFNIPGKNYLSAVFSKLVNNLEELDELYGSYLENGYEGQMVRVNAPYETKRSRTLLKRKEFDDGEFEISYLESGIGNWDGAVKRVYIILEDGSIQKAGVRGTYEMLAEYLSRADEFKGTEVTIRYQGRTADGKLRFPVITHFWQGKRDV